METAASRVCGAQLRGQPGRTCQKSPVAGRQRCRLHGGLSPMGTRSATFKHGRYSRCLPTALAKRYHAARRDPALLELRDGIALTDARICELLGMREIAWPDVLNALNVQRRLIAAECRRMHEQSRYVPVDEALSLVGAIVASVRAVCTDEQIAVVQNDVRRLLLLRTNS